MQVGASRALLFRQSQTFDLGESKGSYLFEFNVKPLHFCSVCDL